MALTRTANLRCLIAALAWLACGCLSPIGVSHAGENPQADPARHFDDVLAPLLATRCLTCHNPNDKKGGLDLTSAEAAMAGGDSGTVIEPKQPDDSLLWSRIEADEMPPKQPLPAEERQLVRDWIENGAVWGSGPIDRFRYTTDARAGYDWWSLQPIQRSAVPELPDGALPRNAIDHFIDRALHAKGLAQSPEADRRTLIRRLSFDLTGLPPALEEVAAFVDDTAPDAYERLVDRLLASTQYGVRWARHWLDIVRYGESNGFEYDEYRPNSWPYRDWVVDALNADLPFDEFTRLQIAGDVLYPGELNAAIATGFLAAGAYDTAGQGQQSLAMRAVVRADEMEDLIGTVSQTFLGLTVNCARCHDHKFDPIRQSEYYALVSAMSGIRHADRDIGSLTPGAARAARLAELDARRQELLSELASIEQPAREAILAKGAIKPADLGPLATWDFTRGSEGQPVGWEVTLHGAARLTPDGLELADDTAYAASGTLPKQLRAKTLEAWVRLANLDQRGGSALGVQTVDGRVFDSIVFAERESRHWLAGSDHFTRTRDFHGIEEIEGPGESVHICITYGEDGTIAAYRNGQPYGQPYRATETASFVAGQAQVVFGMRHGPPGPGKMLRGTLERARLYDRALTADEVASASGRSITREMIQEQLAEDQRPRYDELQAQLAHASATLQALHPLRVYSIKPQQPEPTRLLARGNPAEPKEIVRPGGIHSLAGFTASFELEPDAPEADRRQKLAEWITDRHNPLFARVIVNRLWHYHFGAGLVDTPNDFGFNGGRPTNQALLDWLAAELIDNGYHLKPMHRLIVTSATYRQASRSNSHAAAIDAENRLLWRKSPQRLEAEAVRDSMLSVAGVLDLSQGGPGFQEMKMSIAPGTNTFLYAPDDPTRDIFKRRTLYRVWARSGRSPLLDVLDCPDPSTTSPKRAVTTTPLQALALLNNAFVLHVAERFAERIAREAGSDPDQQVVRAYQLAYGRAPDEDEQSVASKIVQEHGLGVLARALFNSNEFVYVD